MADAKDYLLQLSHLRHLNPQLLEIDYLALFLRGRLWKRHPKVPLPPLDQVPMWKPVEMVALYLLALNWTM